MSATAIDGQPDRRTRKREARRDRVYTTAIELFVSRGYENVTMEDIAERADVARATVFNHFPRKGAILAEWAQRRRDAAREAVRHHHLAGQSIEGVLGRYMTELAAINVKTRAETVALVAPAMQQAYELNHPELGQALASFVRQAQQDSEVRPGVDVEQVGYLLAAGYRMTLSQWIDVEPEPFELAEALNGLLDLVLHGLHT